MCGALTWAPLGLWHLPGRRARGSAIAGGGSRRDPAAPCGAVRHGPPSWQPKSEPYGASIPDVLATPMAPDRYRQLCHALLWQAG